MVQKLRDYQISAIEGIRKAFRDGAKSVLLCLPCGLGKTTVSAHFFMGLLAKGNKGAFIVHRRELTEQARERMAQHSIPFGTVESGFRPDFAKPIQICSIMSLLSHLNPADPETAPDPINTDFIIIDEAHRSEAKSYKRVRSHFPNALVLGVTATPIRGDGKPLGDSYQAMVEVIDVATAIERGYLCDYRIFEGDYASPDDGLEPNADGEFDKLEAAKRINTDRLVGDVYANWKRRADGKRTIIFAQSESHGKRILEKFKAHGENFHYIDYRTPKEERGRITNWLRQGKITGVINLSIYGEGVDIPRIECIVMARMTASLAVWIQFSMRGMRPLYASGMPLETDEQRLAAIAAESKADGCIILDHGGNARHRFGGPDAPHEWSLDGRKKREQPVQPSLTTCPQCLAIVTARMRICPDCGYELAARAPKVDKTDATDGMLVEANYKIRGSEREERRKAKLAAMSEKERRAAEREAARVQRAAAEAAKIAKIEDGKKFLREAIALARRKGYNFKHPLMKLKERFGSGEKSNFQWNQYGVSVKRERQWIVDREKLGGGEFRHVMVSFEFEGVVYGAQTAE